MPHLAYLAFVVLHILAAFLAFSMEAVSRSNLSEVDFIPPANSAPR